MPGRGTNQCLKSSSVNTTVRSNLCKYCTQTGTTYLLTTLQCMNTIIIANSKIYRSVLIKDILKKRTSLSSAKHSWQSAAIIFRSPGVFVVYISTHHWAALEPNRKSQSPVNNNLSRKFFGYLFQLDKQKNNSSPLGVCTASPYAARSCCGWCERT